MRGTTHTAHCRIRAQTGHRGDACLLQQAEEWQACQFRGAVAYLSRCRSALCAPTCVLPRAVIVRAPEQLCLGVTRTKTLHAKDGDFEGAVTALKGGLRHAALWLLCDPARHVA